MWVKIREFGLSKLQDIKAKIEEFDKRIKELEEAKTDSNNCDVKMATSVEQVIVLARPGYDCQPIGDNKWLMRNKIRKSQNTNRR